MHLGRTTAPPPNTNAAGRHEAHRLRGDAGTLRGAAAPRTYGMRNATWTVITTSVEPGSTGVLEPLSDGAPAA